MPRSLLALSLLALTACGDTDGDGLSDAREEQIGSDPKLADTDGDGMNDKDEVAADVDPTLWDTDGDGYSDFQEIDFGSDPLDVASGVYAGGWPYNPFKDDLEDPGSDTRLQFGERFARFVAVDQYGEQVDLYDYAGQGKDVMIDISAMWCGPCKEVSGWLAGNNPSGFNTLAPVREAVNSGDLLWVTILSEDNQGNFPDADELGQWAERYENPEIVVLQDTAQIDVIGYLNPGFLPSLYLLDENLELVKGPSASSWGPPLEEAMDRLAE